MTTDKHQPTVEQSLHSIALSLIELNKGLEQVRRVQKKSLTHAKKTDSMWAPIRQPQKRGPFDWLKRFIPSRGEGAQVSRMGGF